MQKTIQADKTFLTFTDNVTPVRTTAVTSTMQTSATHSAQGTSTRGTAGTQNEETLKPSQQRQASGPLKQIVTSAEPHRIVFGQEVQNPHVVPPTFFGQPAPQPKLGRTGQGMSATNQGLAVQAPPNDVSPQPYTSHSAWQGGPNGTSQGFPFPEQFVQGNYQNQPIFGQHNSASNAQVASLTREMQNLQVHGPPSTNYPIPGQTQHPQQVRQDVPADPALGRADPPSGQTHSRQQPGQLPSAGLYNTATQVSASG